MTIKANMEFIDRVTRLVLALVFVVLNFTGVAVGFMGIVLVSLAIIFALTTTFKYCPIYTLFGANSCDSQRTV
ncbi:MAG: DUF2892 domain-containing protein [Bacteroidetes bacterium]|nr:DUF2892 domain-containing protein [Bacteroidota bacterium]MDA1118882.1 DUF2892 domain-containing protein [Bacteroidota bacterium]